MPPSTNNGKPYLGYVVGNGNSIFLFLIDEKTKKFIQRFQFSTIKELLKSILKHKGMLKVIFLNICMLQTSEYANNLEASKAVRSFLMEQKLQFQFFSFESMMSLSIMVAANISSAIDDDIITLRMEPDKVIIKFYRFTENGYWMFGYECLMLDMGLENLATRFADVMIKCQFKKMILFTLEPDSTLLNKFAALLKSSKSFNFNGKLIVIDFKKYIATEATGAVIIEISKWFFDNRNAKYYILPTIPRMIEIMGVTGDLQKKFMSIEPKEQLPFKKSIIFNKSVQKCLMLSYYTDSKDIIQTLEVDQNCHQHKLTITVESECFPELKIEPIIIPEIKNLPSKLNELKMDIPVVGFFRRTSVICVHGNGNGYKFLDSWNGLYGNELFINFDETKPKYGMNAITVDKTTMSFVVYDLIKIMSMPTEKVTANPNWKFTFTKDAENPVLIEFDNFDGTKKAATPAFLMALLLKEHLKLIKKEMKEDEKPKKIGFCLFDKFNDAERERVEKGLEEACELLKISCTFIKL